MLIQKDTFQMSSILSNGYRKDGGCLGDWGRLTVFDSKLVYTEGAQHGEHV